MSRVPGVSNLPKVRFARVADVYTYFLQELGTDPNQVKHVCCNSLNLLLANLSSQPFCVAPPLQQPKQSGGGKSIYFSG